MFIKIQYSLLLPLIQTDLISISVLLFKKISLVQKTLQKTIEKLYKN